jgi:RHS repeat-associated protein
VRALSVSCGKDWEFVGDPVSVITGANTEVTRDFRLTGPLVLDWERHYDSSLCHRRFSLGWGHSHAFDRTLIFDADGVRHVGPLERAVGFPPLLADGEQVARAGLRLRRIAPTLYEVAQGRQPVGQFEVRDFARPVPLTRLRKGEATIEFVYDEGARLRSILDSSGRTIRVESDERGLLVRLWIPGGRDRPDRILLTYEYDDAGNLVRGTDPYGSVFSFDYDALNRVDRRSDRLGYSFRFFYDKHGRCVRTAGEDGLHDTRLRFLTAEGATVVTRADEGEWTYLYETGNLTKIIDPYGGVLTFIPDGTGRTDLEVDANGNATTLVYDSAGGLAGRISPIERFTPVPEPPHRQDRWEHRIPRSALEWEYGDLSLRFGRRAREPSLEHLPPQFRGVPRPPAAGGVWLGATRKVYDDFGNLIREETPAGRARRYVYDPNGNLHRFTDFDGSERIFRFRGWNQMSSCTDALQRSVRYQYTSTERISAITDRGGSTSEYAYDLRDRLVEVRRHGVVKERYRYDDADQLVEKLNGLGESVVSYEIGSGNRKAARHLRSGENHFFEYDEHGRFRSVSTDDLAVGFAYDEWGNRVEDKRNGKGVEHRFDNVGRLVGTTYLGRFDVRYTYGPGGRVGITDPMGGDHSIRPLGGGVFLRRFSNGTSELSQYDHEGRGLLKASSRNLSRDLWKRTFAYSGEGDLLEARDSERGATKYGYDFAHRLVSVSSSDGSEATYAYDDGDNLIRAPGLEEVVLLQGNRLEKVNGDRFAYDDRNNMSTRAGAGGETRYWYDSKDMLIRCDIRGEAWEATYDPLGRRATKTFRGACTEFYWDADRLAAEVAADGTVRIYVYAAPLAMVPLFFVEFAALDAEPESGRIHFLFTDQIGAPRLVEDESGSVVWSARMSSYGATEVDAESSVSLNLRFPGHYFDTETQLHYNRFRYYSPELGRYLQPDPAGLMGGFNLYAYTASPLANVDLRGLDPCPACEAGTRRAEEEGLEHEDLPRPSELEPVVRGDTPPFSDLPSFENMSASEIRRILEDAGFSQTQHERTVELPVFDDDGNPVGTRTATDPRGGSEIWMRRDENGNYEAVRMDQHGHERPDFIPPGEDFHGEPAHVHREHLPNDQERRDGATTRDGDPVLPPGSSEGDAADSYNEQFTPGVYDTYGDNGDQTANTDFPANHTTIEGPG